MVLDVTLTNQSNQSITYSINQSKLSLYNETKLWDGPDTLDFNICPQIFLHGTENPSAVCYNHWKCVLSFMLYGIIPGESRGLH